MPRGTVHLAIELGTLPAWVVAGGALGVARASLVLFAGSYVGASLFLSPDLDLARSDASQRWRAARFLWLPYAALFRHRGISHSPLLGPLTRLLYLVVLGGLGWGLLHAVAGVPFPRAIPWESALPVLVGLYLPQLLHVLLDRVVTSGKRVFRRG
jgi:uncharacterized metal-binding protein